MTPAGKDIAFELTEQFRFNDRYVDVRSELNCAIWIHHIILLCVCDTKEGNGFYKITSRRRFYFDHGSSNVLYLFCFVQFCYVFDWLQKTTSCFFFCTFFGRFKKNVVKDF